MKKTSILIFLFILVLASSCATQSLEIIDNPPGFWHGLFHVFTVMFSFFVSLFTDYEVYAFPNSGNWYNFGFWLGVIMFFGGSGGAASKKRR